MTETPTTRAFPACRGPTSPRQFPRAWVPPLIPRPENRWRAYSLSGTPAMRLCRVEARMAILLVEDEEELAAHITRGLRKHGLETDHAARGDLGYQAALDRAYDLLI